MLPLLGRLGRTLGQSFRFVGSLALKFGPLRHVLPLVAAVATVVILC